jgi:hypothetical protein
LKYALEEPSKNGFKAGIKNSGRGPLTSGPKGTARSHAVVRFGGDVKASVEDIAVAVPAIPTPSYMISPDMFSETRQAAPLSDESLQVRIGIYSSSNSKLSACSSKHSTQ